MQQHQERPKRYNQYSLACSRVLSSDGVIVDNLSNNKHDALPRGRAHTTYFLTHAHMDHMTGFRRQGPPKTARFVCASVPTLDLLTARYPGWLKASQMGQLIALIPDGKMRRIGNLNVMAVDATHMPGSLIIGIRTDNNKHSAVFSGDFRFDAQAQTPLLRVFRGCDVLCVDDSRGEVQTPLPPIAESGHALRQLADRMKKQGKVYLRARQHGCEPLLAAAFAHTTDHVVYIDARFPDPAWTRHQLRRMGVNTSESIAHATVVLTPFVPPVSAKNAICIGFQWHTCQNKLDTTADRYCIRFPYSAHANAAETKQLIDKLKPQRVMNCQAPIAQSACHSIGYRPNPLRLRPRQWMRFADS